MAQSRNFGLKKTRQRGRVEFNSWKELEGTGQLCCTAVYFANHHLQWNVSLVRMTGGGPGSRSALKLPTAGVDMPVDNGMRPPAKPLLAGVSDAYPK